MPLLLTQLSDSDELLIIDNNSTDDTSEYLSSLSHPALKKIFESRQGLNICRGVATRQARHDWVAFIDDDARPHPSWLEAFRKSINGENGDVAIYAGKTLIEYQTANLSYLAPKFSYLLGGKDYGEAAFVLSGGQSPGGGNMMINRHMILALGGFDERFDRRGTRLLSNGETELVDRIYSRGWKIVYVPDAVIHNWAGAERLNERWLLKRMYWQGISDGLLAKERNRTLRLCCRRFLSHLLRIPLEATISLANPRLSLFTVRLEVAKTLGILKSFRLNIDDVRAGD